MMVKCSVSLCAVFCIVFTATVAHSVGESDDTSWNSPNTDDEQQTISLYRPLSRINIIAEIGRRLLVNVRAGLSSR